MEIMLRFLFMTQQQEGVGGRAKVVGRHTVRAFNRGLNMIPTTVKNEVFSERASTCSPSLKLTFLTFYSSLNLKCQVLKIGS